MRHKVTVCPPRRAGRHSQLVCAKEAIPSFSRRCHAPVANLPRVLANKAPTSDDVIMKRKKRELQQQPKRGSTNMAGSPGFAYSLGEITLRHATSVGARASSGTVHARAHFHDHDETDIWSLGILN